MAYGVDGAAVPGRASCEARQRRAAGFSLAFFGIGVLRFWYQYNLYNLHATTDYGAQVALTNILRALVIGALLACAFRHELSRRVRGALVWASLVLMTLSGAFGALDLAVDSATLEVLRYATCGVGLVWGGAMWMDVYARLEPRRVLLFLAGGVALSCALSLVCGYLSPLVMSLVNLFVPTVAVLCYWRSMQLLDDEGAPGSVQVDRLYDAHRGGVLRALASFFLFTLVLGIALGFPDGAPRELPAAYRAAHQLALVAVLLFVLVWVLQLRRRLWFPAVWCLENALLITAVVLLVSEAPHTFELATSCMLTAESLFYPLIFYISYELGRHMRRTSMFMLGVLYGGALFCMGAGRLLSFFAGSLPGGVMAMTVAMSVLVVAEMLLALRFTATSGGLPLFADLDEGADGGEGARFEPGGRATEGALACDGCPESGDAPACDGWEASGAAYCACDCDPAGLEDGERGAGTRVSEGSGLEKAGGVVAPEASDILTNAGLTPVERRIVELMAHGRSRAVIAKELGYSENTIRNYTRNIYRKFGVHGKQELLDALGSD